MDNNMLLLKTQKNNVFEILNSIGFAPIDFKWLECPSLHVPKLIVNKLVYRDEQYYFQFDFLQGKHYCFYSPDEDTPLGMQYPGSWDVQCQYFINWARVLKREIEAPDLWSEIIKYQPSFSYENNVIINEPIPAYQVEQIVIALQDIGNKIRSHFAYTDDQMKFVNQKLDYLADAAKRQGRQDWMYTFIGVISSVAMSLLMAPEQTKQLWQWVKEALGRFFYLISG